VDQIKLFINDPLVAPIWALLVISAVDFALAVYRSVQQHVFDFRKLPEILDALVLSVVIPLAALGVASFFVTDPTAKTALQAAYIAGAATALAGAVASLIRKVSGAYVATTKAMDKGMAPTPLSGPGT
jgi:lysylphosphatidylglycerol synthetase-like protein (DUF2156 family)